MPARDATRFGEPCWADLLTSDPDGAREFYGRLFGWTAVESSMEGSDYVTFRHGDADVAGMAVQMPDSESPDVWSIYLAVEDVDASTVAARAAGGQVLAEPMNIGSMGRMAILSDPTGATVGLWQPIDFTGFGVIGEVGTPLWHELNTLDYPAAVAFYEKAFGWTPSVLSDTDEFRYSTIGAEGAMVAGIFDASAHLPAGMPSHWQLYLGVADVAAAAALVTELGGTVLQEPWSAEFGTFSRVADRTGAMFVLGSVD
ncbi:VOC family protein [Cryobacterium sp. PH31-AA6]|uniref:VOC family protein n=1 Tax=Cryobacterium sp. PH31-AA6 TaxID=3046205 RepID=UPI0024B8F83B|nr:VOC family protein [Cryobacterium sp. PH31-AA6]MDJ0323857.1 VOC family protein [Cryobacterium sp. PH31-AA6]